MGGGDLNSKKSWHPNTMKNQERVWKAEQAAAEEKKRIQELQREHAEERDRTELNNMIKHKPGSSCGTPNDDRLHWMYDKPDKKSQQEDYLLGKSIDKNYDRVNKPEDFIPAVARRVIGSSMISTAGESQVDLARKLREDPLLLVKERERAARAALLNNPLQRRRLAELLRKEQEQRKESKSKKSPKKKEKALDEKLAAKLNALGGKKGLDLATLLASDDSDSSTDDGMKKKKKRRKHDKSKKKSKKGIKKKHHHSDDTSDEGRNTEQALTENIKTNSKNHKNITISRKRKSDNDYSDIEKKSKRTREENHNKYKTEKDVRRHSHLEFNERNNGKGKKEKLSNRSSRNELERNKGRRVEISEEERVAKLAAMAAAGAEREVQRGRRVAEQRVADAAAEEIVHRPRTSRNEARILPESLESRIHSNRHYIQRDARHMNEHFAKR